MEQLALGQATIVYEDPEEGRTEETVDNEELLYARDHWIFTTGTDDEGNDLMRQIPRDRVHFVDRNVERFEEEAQTVRHRVESIAQDIRERLPMDIGNGGRQEYHDEAPPSDSTTVQIETSAEEREHESEAEEAGEQTEEDEQEPEQE